MRNGKEPLVSVGIPTYNRPHTLYRTIESFTKQTYPNIEIIISDNCSPNKDTEEVVREFMAHDPRIRFYRQHSNIGMFYNFRFVFEMSCGEYFTWAADDDSRTHDFIESCINKFNELNEASRNTDLVLVNSFSELVDPVTETVLAVDQGCTTVGMPAVQRYKRYIDSIFKEQAWVGDLIYGVIKREFAARAMSVQPNILGWDHIFLANLALQGEFFTIPKPMMYSSPGGMSTTNAAKIAQIQLIEGSLSQKKRGWVRELYLQRTIRTSNQLSSAQKITLSSWSYIHYMNNRGLKNIFRSFCPELYETLKILFDSTSSNEINQQYRNRSKSEGLLD
jgi:glycosyltransferase involved in cell wall biosynthesis